MVPRSVRLTREGLERLARELGGMKLGQKDIEPLLRRLESLRGALGALQELVEPSVEPLPTVTFEDDE